MTEDEKTQERLEWLRARQRGVGGSDVAAIIGASKYKTPVDIYIEKTTDVAESAASEAAYWGTVLEDTVAQEFSRRTGMKIQRVKQQLRTDFALFGCGEGAPEWARANLDRAVIDRKFGAQVRLTKPDSEPAKAGLMLNTRYILECKTANARMADEWGPSQETEIKAGAIETEAEIPIYYLTQVQWYLGITGAETCFVAVLIGGQDFRIYAVKRDEELVQMLAEKCWQFWRDHVMTNTPPEAVSAEDVKKLYQRDNGDMAEADQEQTALLAQYRELKAQISPLEARLKEVSSQLIAAIGPRTGLTIGGEKAATYKAQTRKSFSSTALKAAEPDVYQRYIKESTIRVLRVS